MDTARIRIECLYGSMYSGNPLKCSLIIHVSLRLEGLDLLQVPKF